MNTDAIPSSMYRRGVIPALLLVSAAFAVGCGGSNSNSVDPLDPQADIDALSELTGIEFGENSIVVHYSDGGSSDGDLFSWFPAQDADLDHDTWTVISSSPITLPGIVNQSSGPGGEWRFDTCVKVIQSRYAEYDAGHVTSVHDGDWNRGGSEYRATLVRGSNGDAVNIQRFGLGNKGNTTGVDDASNE